MIVSLFALQVEGVFSEDNSVLLKRKSASSVTCIEHEFHGPVITAHYGLAPEPPFLSVH